MNNKGFTLIELLVTMGIIAVLTGMAVFNFNQSRMRARDVQRKSDISQLGKALELYKNDNMGKYPATIQQTLIDGEYIKNAFIDPKGDTWGAYSYTTDVSRRSFSLMACLENKSDPVKADATQCSAFGGSCVCGTGGAGVMYVLNNP